ncbi:MAG: nicotinate phosphoribosyltransferase [Bacilli bacterium]|nr:nicotinate phosphoribosyltransferase [Bacilli bacterium]
MERLPRNYTMLTDAYELFMSDSYTKTKEGTEGVFDLFYRVVPNGGGYTIMAGLDKVIEYIQNLKFTDEDIEYFKKSGYNFSEEFLDYLRNFKFTGDIYAIPDGTPVFPNEPLVTVKAPLIEAQIIETAMLSIINGAKEHATGARRLVEATPKNVKIMEFGARRADGLEAAIDSSIYGIMAGCAGTSNVQAAQMLGIKALGTMAHSFVESFDNELDAFIAFAKTHPDNATLLVDTFDTLKCGVPNAIKTFDWMKENGYPTDHIGIRIDSGDLAYLSKEARKMLDDAGYTNAKICLSNGLTAETIESLTSQGAFFDSLGVGDNISKPAGRMGAVYKEVAIIEDGKRTPKIKVSNDIIKIVNPDFKDLYRAYDKNTGYAIADIMCSKDKKMPERNMKIISINDLITNTTIDDYRLVKLQKPIFINGKLVYNDPTIFEKQAYCEEQMQTLYPEVKRTLNPHRYYVDGTEEYVNLKNQMILSHRR